MLFTLDTSRFPAEGLNYIETLIEDRGRGIQLAWVQDAAGQDFELLGFSVGFAAAETQPMDTSV